MYSRSAAVYVAGVGVVSAIGNDTQSCLLALSDSQAGIGPITSLNTIHKNILPVAEVKLTNQQLAESTGLSASYSRTALLGMLAAKEAWQDARISNPASLRTGFI